MSKETFEDFFKLHISAKRNPIRYIPLNNIRMIFLHKTWDYQQKKIDELERKLKRAMEGLGKLEKLEKYYSDMDFSTCCSGQECGCMGLPTDPEYYLLQIVQEILQTKKELEG